MDKGSNWINVKVLSIFARLAFLFIAYATLIFSKKEFRLLTVLHVQGNYLKIILRVAAAGILCLVGSGSTSDVCAKAGKGVYPEYQQKQDAKALTKLDSSNPYWVTFKKECDRLGLKLKEAIFPGGTDSRFLRDIGIPAFGFSPMIKTPVLLHDHDEFLSETTFLTGLDIYSKLIPALCQIHDS